jgi:hypothetical protein
VFYGLVFVLLLGGLVYYLADEGKFGRLSGMIQGLVVIAAGLLLIFVVYELARCLAYRGC